jgi:hypothetical protein
VLSSSVRGYGLDFSALLCRIKYNQTKPPQQHSALRTLRCRWYAVYRCAAARKKNTACISQPGGCIFGCISGLGVFPVYLTPCIFSSVFSTRYFFYFLRSGAASIGSLQGARGGRVRPCHGRHPPRPLPFCPCPSIWAW